MADWRNISDTEVDPDAPVTSELAYAFRDNVIAMAEGASGAPRISGAMISIGNGTMIGAYIMAYTASSVNYADVVAGSSLFPAGALNTASNDPTSGNSFSASAGRRSTSINFGSWRCCGMVSAASGVGSTSSGSSLFQRVA